MLLGGQRINAQGHLEIGGCDALELAREFGTPLYVMDEEVIRNNCRRYKAAFAARYPKNDVSFASKAYLNMAICKVMESEGMSLDVASAGELYTAIKRGLSDEPDPAARQQQVADGELSMALEHGVGHAWSWTALPELRRLAALARGAQGKTQKHFNSGDARH